MSSTAVTPRRNQHGPGNVPNLENGREDDDPRHAEQADTVTASMVHPTAHPRGGHPSTNELSSTDPRAAADLSAPASGSPSKRRKVNHGTWRR
jgi:hypothetical protein